MAMRYDEVNQLAVSKASRSAAIEDWVVVKMEMFVAVMGVITNSAPLPPLLLCMDDFVDTRRLNQMMMKL
jgi:hypothetical protein